MDFSQIETALGLASSALGTTGKAVATFEAVKKLLKSEKKPDSGEADTLLSTLATELTTANVMNVQLSEALKALSRELKQQDEFEKEKSRYELFRTGQNDMVFRLKGGAANGQPDHFICPVCLNRDKLVSFITGEGDYKHCQTSRDHIFTFNKTNYSRPTSGSGWL